MKLLPLFFTCFVLVLGQIDPYLGIKKSVLPGSWSSAQQYSSVAEFKDGEDIDDNQHIMLAKQAFQEMHALADAAKVKMNARPVVMSALRVGQQFYFSSNLKGAKENNEPVGFGYTFSDSKVKAALSRCQHAMFETADPEGTWPLPDKDPRRHRNNANCGEVLSVHQWYRDHAQNHPEIELRDQKQLKKMVSVSYKSGDKPNISLKDPCEVQDDTADQNKDPNIHWENIRIMSWGCEAFAPSEGLDVIIRKDGKTDYDPPRARPIRTRQIPLCG